MRLYFRGRRIRLSQKRESILARRIMALVLLLVFAVLTTVAIYNKAAPIAAENAAALARNQWESVINESVDSVMRESNYNYDSFATQGTDGDGKITSLSVNSRNITSVRTAIVKDLNKRLSQNDTVTISVPIGSVVAPRFLQGAGFGIKINAMTYTAVSVTVISEVSAVGINQTMHRISAHITTDTTLYCINEKNEFTYQYDVILVESLSFGRIPDSYFEYGGG